MQTYLVVAHRTLVGQHLLDHVRTISDAAGPGQSRFYLVVPVRHPRDHAWTDGEVEATARLAGIRLAAAPVRPVLDEDRADVLAGGNVADGDQTAARIGDGRAAVAGARHADQGRAVGDQDVAGALVAAVLPLVDRPLAVGALLASAGRGEPLVGRRFGGHAASPRPVRSPNRARRRPHADRHATFRRSHHVPRRHVRSRPSSVAREALR